MVVRQIDIGGLAAAIESGAVVVDVREAAEHAAGHVPGARNIPAGHLADRLDDLDRGAPVHLVCASGNRSAAMAAVLAARGFDVVDVLGGTTAWIRSGRPVEHGSAPRGSAPAPLTVVPLDTPSLGDRSYVVHDGELAFVVDPQRDIDRVLALLAEHGVRLTHVLETHLHNDYVTGGLALAAATGAAYVVNGAEDVSFERTRVTDGDEVRIGSRIRLRVLATPGHTFHHLSYALHDLGTGADVGVFSGGSLLFGATGRPDLLGDEHADALARHQHASAHRLAALLPDAAEVFPTHGFGSFCSATQSDATSSTIGRERSTNPVLTQDEETYVRGLLAGLGAWPAYYGHMAPANAAGPSAPDLSLPARADAAELRRRIEAGEWVVDLRHRTAFAAGHARGALSFGVEGPLATYLGWLVPWGAPVTLLGETVEQVAAAQRELVRIGIDRPAAHATGGPADWVEPGEDPAAFATGTFADLAHVRHHRPVVVLDVRRVEEHAVAAIRGAVSIPLHELTGRLDELPEGEVWVHCAGGYRAAVAASILDAAGRATVAVDDAFDHARPAGLDLVGPES